jgi:hypothetical protein
MTPREPASASEGSTWGERLAAVHGADRVGKLVEQDVHEQVTARARADRLEEVLLPDLDEAERPATTRGFLRR